MFLLISFWLYQGNHSAETHYDLLYCCRFIAAKYRLYYEAHSQETVLSVGENIRGEKCRLKGSVMAVTCKSKHFIKQNIIIFFNPLQYGIGYQRGKNYLWCFSYLKLDSIAISINVLVKKKNIISLLPQVNIVPQRKNVYIFMQKKSIYLLKT